jgi:hypothetical protein
LPLPAHLRGPDLLPGADGLLSAFWELCNDRPVGWGVARIPGAAIRDYARSYQITDIDELVLLTRVVRACDAVVIEKMKNREGGHG